MKTFSQRTFQHNDQVCGNRSRPVSDRSQSAGRRAAAGLDGGRGLALGASGEGGDERGVELRAGERCSSASAVLGRLRLAVGRSLTIASKASQTATMRAPSGISSPAGGPGSRRRPSARGWADDAATPANSGAARDDALADDRVLAHVLPLLVGERARGLCRIASGIAILPMSCSSAARANLEPLGLVEAELAPDRADEIGDVLDVIVQLAVCSASAAQQHLVTTVGRWSGGRRACSRTCAGRRGAARRPGRFRGLRERDDAVRAADLEAAAGLAQRFRGGGRAASGRRVSASTQNSSPPSGRRCRRRAIASIRFAPRRASRASPAGGRRCRCSS